MAKFGKALQREMMRLIKKIGHSTETKLQHKRKTNAQCRLLILPAELRNIVWQMAMSEDEITLPCATPPILQTCLQIRGEAYGYWLLNQTVAMKPATQQWIRDTSSRKKLVWRRSRKTATAMDTLVAFLERTEAQISNVGGVRITVGIFPRPPHSVNPTLMRALDDCLHLTPHAEVLLEFRGPMPDTSSTLEVKAEHCSVCESLNKYRDSSRGYDSMSKGNNFFPASDGPWYGFTGLHAEIADCIVHAAFGTCRGYDGDFWRDADHLAWLCVIIPQIQKLLTAGRKKAGDWKALLKSVEAVKNIEYIEPGPYRFRDVDTLKRNMQLEGVKWKSFDIRA